MGYMKEQKYILAVAVCAGIIVTVPEILQAESITVENRSETRTSVEKNGTLADRVQRAQSSVSIAGETQNRDEAEKAFESLQRHEDAMRMKPMYSDERLERQYKTGVVLNELLAPLVNPNRNVPRSIGTLAGMTFQNDKIMEHGILAKFKSGGKWGILGTDGKELVAPKYRDITGVDNNTGVIHALVNKKTGEELFNKKTGEELSEKGKVLTPEQVEELAAKEKAENGKTDVKLFASDSYVSFKEKGRYGFKDEAGNVVISPRYKDVITEFHEDRAFVKNEKGKIVAIDIKGAELFQAPSEEVYAYKNGLAEYRRKVSGFNVGSLLGFVTGGILQGGFGYNNYGLGGFAYDGVKRGYIDSDGHVVVDGKNDKVWPMTWYGTVIKNDGKTGFVNRKGEYVIQPGDYDVGGLDEINGLLVLKDSETGKSGLFNVETGRQEIPFLYDNITFAGSDRLIVDKNGVRSLYDMKTGRALFSVSTDVTIDPFAHDRVTWVHQGKGNYKIINDAGKVLYVDAKGSIDDVKSFNHGFSAVHAEGKWGIMDVSGKWLVRPQYQNVEIL